MKHRFLFLLIAQLTQITSVWARGASEEDLKAQQPTHQQKFHIRIELQSQNGNQSRTFNDQEMRLVLVIKPNLSSVTKKSLPIESSPVEKIEVRTRPQFMDYRSYYQQAVSDPEFADFIRDFPNLHSETVERSSIAEVRSAQVIDDKKKIQTRSPDIVVFQEDLEAIEEDQYIGLVMEEVEETDAIQFSIQATAVEKGIPFKMEQVGISSTLNPQLQEPKEK